MAATLDDLLAVAYAIQVDMRVQLDNVTAAIGGTGGGGGGTGTAPAAKPFLDKMEDTLQKVTAAATKAQAGLTAFVGVFDKVISSLGGGMAQFVQLANPATVIRFNMAVENAMSAMGRVLVPVMEKFTGMIQGIGNAVESLSPQAKQLVAGLAAGGGLAGVLGALATGAAVALRALGPIPSLVIAVASAVAGVMVSTSSGKAVMESFSKAMQAFGSVVEVVARTLLPVMQAVLIPLFDTLAQGMLEAASAVRVLVDEARVLVGLGRIGYDPNAKQAAAVRQGGMGDLRGYANRAYTSGFNSGSVADKQLEEAKKHTELLRAIAARNDRVRAQGEEMGRNIGGDSGGRVGRALASYGNALLTAPVDVVRRMGAVLFD